MQKRITMSLTAHRDNFRNCFCFFFNIPSPVCLWFWINIRFKIRIKRLPGLGGVLKELAFGGENNQGNISITQNGDLICFLQQSRASLRESDLPADLVFDPFQLNPTSSHLCTRLVGLMNFRYWMVEKKLFVFGSKKVKKKNPKSKSSLFLRKESGWGWSSYWYDKYYWIISVGFLEHLRN